MDRQGATYETDRRDTVAVLLNASDGSLLDPGMRCEAQVVVRGEHHDVFPVHANNGSLLGIDQRFLFVGLGASQAFKFRLNRFL